MTSFPFTYQNSFGANGTNASYYYQRSKVGINPSSPNTSYTNASSNASQYYTYYCPMKSYIQEEDNNTNRQLVIDYTNRKMPITSFDSNKRSSSVYTYPYNYSNDYYSNNASSSVSYIQNEKKKKLEYGHYLRKQIEEKQKQKALEYKKLQYDKANREFLFNSPNKSISNYHNYPTNDNSLNKISLNGMSIVDTSNRGINVLERTPPIQYSSNDNRAIGNSIVLPASLGNIDLKALKYHSKYENCDTEDKSEGCNDALSQFVAQTRNDKDIRNSDRDKGYSFNNRLNNNMKDDLKNSLKGSSTLVQADDSKGAQIVKGFLKVWDDKQEKETSLSNTDNKRLHYDKLIQSNFISKDRNSKMTQVKDSLSKAETYYKDSKSYYTNNMPFVTKIIAKPSIPITVNNNNNTNADISLNNKQYNRAIDFQKNMPLPIIEPTIDTNDNIIPLHKTKRDTYNKPDIFNDIPSLSYNQYQSSMKAFDKPIINQYKDEDYKIYKQLLNKVKEEDDKAIEANDKNTIDKPTYSLKESNKDKALEEEPVSMKSKEKVFFNSNSKWKDNKNDDELCNIRYDSDSDNESNNFIPKPDEENETTKNEQEDITCNFLDDNEDDGELIKPIAITNTQGNINNIKESITNTAKFQSQINFFDQSGNESFAFKKGPNHIINQDILSFGNSNQSNQIVNTNNSSKDNNNNNTNNANTLIKTIKDIQPNTVLSPKPIEDSIDVHDSFTDKIIKDLGNFQLKENKINSSHNIL